MLKIDGETDLNKISLTGARSLALIGLLIIAPRSLEEIRQAFIDMKIMEESHSYDIIRIDLNTIKAMGCEISRACAKTGFKYVLSKQPFSIKMTEEDIKLLKRIYDKIKSEADISLLIEYEKLFQKIAGYIYDEETKQAFLGISVLKYLDTELVSQLLEDCQNKMLLDLEYQKPTSKSKTNKQILAQKLVFKNDKIYLYGYDVNKNIKTVLNIKGIKSIISRTLFNKQIETKTVNVVFSLKDSCLEPLSEEEFILEKKDNIYLIEGRYFNEFLAMQRILSFGTNCVVHKPLDFKNKVIAKLREMKGIYER